MGTASKRSSVGQYLLEIHREKRIAGWSGPLETGHSVAETARLCGFDQASRFIQAFKAEVGCTPLRYARRGAGGPGDGKNEKT